MPALPKPTDAKIKMLKEAGKYACGQGLQVYISSAGSKKWQYRYRFNDKENTLTFGDTNIISLAEARQMQLQAAQLIKNGIDPAEVKKNQKNERIEQAKQTFEAVMLAWFEHWKSIKNISDGHARKTMQRLNKDVLPLIGNRPIKNLKRTDIVKLVESPVNRGALDIAARTIETTSAVFEYAHNMGFIDENPATGLSAGDLVPKVKVVHMPRIKTEEVPELIKAIDTTEMNVTVRYFLRIMMLVFTRCNELLQSEWSEFDFKNKVWHIAPKRMKDRKPHHVPLADQTISLLLQLKDLNLSKKYVFPAASRKSGNGCLSETSARKTLEKMGYKPKKVIENGIETVWGMSIHGFRGIASTALSETTNPAAPSVLKYVVQQSDNNKNLGKNLIVEAQLAHRMGDGSSVPYNMATHWDARVTMMQEWADWLDRQRELAYLKVV